MKKENLLVLEIRKNYQTVLELFENNFFERVKFFHRDNRINSLIEQKILINEEKEIYINFNLESNVLLKKLIDQIKFERIDLKRQKEILYIKNLLLKENRNKIFSIFVTGSVARNTHNNDSDIDIVVIHSGEKIVRPKVVNNIFKIQLITFSKEAFSLQYLDDQELLIWTLKFGLLIYDKNYIFKKAHGLELSHCNNNLIIKKRSQIDHMCEIFERILKDNDLDSRELIKIMHKILHLMSRYIIFINGDFPFSRPELRQQVQQYSNEIVNIFEVLDHEHLSTNELVDIYYKLKKVFKDFSIKQ